MISSVFFFLLSLHGCGDRCRDGPCSPALTAPLSLPAVVSGDEPREKIELVTYFGKRPPGVLHCTTKFCDYGKAAGAEEYAQQDVSAPQGHPAEVGRGQGLLEMGAGSRQGPETRQPLRRNGISCSLHPSTGLVTQMSPTLSGEHPPAQHATGLCIHPEGPPTRAFYF